MSLTNKPKPIEYIPSDCSIEVWEDIPKTVNVNSNIKSIVDTNLKGYETINVQEAMKQLATVGDLLKVANAAAHGFSCSVPIIGILADYQSLVNDTVMTTSEFVYNSIAAINQHKLALRIAEKYPEKALAIIGKTCDKAKEMSVLAGKLVDMAKSLVDKSTEALKLATDNQVEKINEEKENEKKRQELEARGAELRSEIEDLKAQVAELKEMADKAGKDAAEERKTAMILNIVGAITKPLAQLAGSALGGMGGNSSSSSSDESSSSTSSSKPSATEKIKKEKKELNDQVDEKKKELKEKQEEKSKLDAIEKPTPEQEEKKKQLTKTIGEIQDGIKSLGDSLSQVANDIAKEYKEQAAASKDKETEYLKLKNQYQDMERKSNAELAGSLVKLKSLSEERNYLQVSIKSLELTIKTMGRVRVIFENTRLFWLQVEAQCKRLSDPGSLKDMAEIASMDADFMIDYTNEIKKSGLNWLALANINYVAAMAIMGVKKNFDAVMSNLPGKSEAEEIVKSCTSDIQKSLEEDNKRIDQNSNDTKKQIENLNTPIPQQA